MQPSTRKRDRIIQHNGRSVGNSKSRSHQNTETRDSQQENAANPHSLSRFNPLRLNFKKKHLFEVQSKKNYSAKGDKHNQDILTLCEQLYPVIRAYYKQYRLAWEELVWNNDARPWKLLKWLITTISKAFPKDVQWHITQSDEEYFLVQYHFHLKVHGPIAIPMNFLPTLKVNNPLLHDFVFNVFKKVNLPVLPNNMFFDILEVLDEQLLNVETKEEKKELKACIKEYTTGNAKKYIKDIKIRNMSDKQLLAIQKQVKTINEEEETLFAWAIDLWHTSKGMPDLQAFEYLPSNPDMEDMHGVLLSSCVGFLWNSHDEVTSYLDDWLNSGYNEGGEESPCSVHVLSVKNCKNIEPDPRLEKFLITAQKGFDACNNYHDTYARNINSGKSK